VADLQAIAQPQRERLFHIDFRAEFLGSVTRGNLVRRFGLKEAAATRDLALYRSLAPANLAFDQRSKTYVRAETFAPLFEHDPAHTLTALAEGLGDDAVGDVGPHVRTERPLRLNQPDIAIIAAVCRAIATRRALHVRYVSLTTGETERTIVPFALVDTGVRWHVRAFDRRRERYLDFVMTRIVEAEPVGGELPTDTIREGDAQWMRLVELELVPHPGLPDPAPVERDYAMTDGVLRVTLRAALVGYALLHWSVDATDDHALSPDRHHLWLRNAPALYGVENLAIAPGLGSR
jgi:hypothetical protein